MRGSRAQLYVRTELVLTGRNDLGGVLCCGGRTYRVQNCTLQMPNGAAPGKSTTFVWMLRKGGPPATQKILDRGVQYCETMGELLQILKIFLWA